ncbi:MAG: hypothetical protein CME38_09615 [Haliea sp.]|nr:hypothetical protein [Haliea sp.]
MSWIVQECSSREAIMARLPQLGEPFLAMYENLWEQPHVPGPVLELCRLRMAQLHRSEGDQNLAVVPVDAARRSALRDWHRSPLFTEAERACLEFTEIYAMDALAITDAQAEAVKSHYGDVGLVALVQSLGVFDGLQRLGLIWQTSKQEA